MRHPSVLFAPSSLHSFALVQLRYAPHRHHRTSPRSAPRLDCICVKGKRWLSRTSTFHEWKFDLHGSDLTAQWVGFLHIARGRGGREEKRASARWGVSVATTGASPRPPELPHSSVVTSRNPLQIEEFCRRDPCRCSKFA